MRKAEVLLVAAACAVLAGCGSPPPTTLPVMEDDQTAVTAAPTSLPADWPDDLPRPVGLTLVSATRLDSPQGPTWSATWQGSGSAGDLYAELTEELRVAGFTEEDTLGGTEGEGGISTWNRGTMRLQLTVLAEDDQVGVNVTAINSAG